MNGMRSFELDGGELLERGLEQLHNRRRGPRVDFAGSALTDQFTERSGQYPPPYEE
jgi:hypothetical protein